ncbi:hypothetical protein [Streptomyces sp. NPDC058623]|uniref:hypothetical protein n=1 Tax=Streptomyces sp. NPDC058623 TaxID=3346563 RepID=UPI00365F4751
MNLSNDRPGRGLSAGAAEVLVGAAGGLVVGAYVASAPLLGGRLGMPGEAVRYLLITGLLLAASVGGLAGRRRTAGQKSPAAAARWLLSACVLCGAAAAFPSPVVFSALLMVAALVSGAGLSRYRPSHAWHAAFLTGFAAAAAVTALLATTPYIACAASAALAALLLVPLCARSTGDSASDLVADTGSAGVAAVVGAAVMGTVFAAHGLVVFRWELLGARAVWPLAYAFGLAAPVVWVLALADRRRPPARPGYSAVLLAGLTAAVGGCAAAGRPWQLTVALSAVLVCSSAAITASTGQARRGRPARAEAYVVAALAGGAASATAVALSPRLLGGSDTLTAIGLAPGLPAVLTLLSRGPARATVPDVPAQPGGQSAEYPVTARRLGVTERGSPPVRNLELALPRGRIVYLTDQLGGRRAGAVLSVLEGSRRPDRGRWLLHGHDVSRVDPRARWDLRLSVFADPADPTRLGALPRAHPAASVGEALTAAAARLSPDRSAVGTEAAYAAFPFLTARGESTPQRLDPAERCVLALVQTLIAQPALLLLDLTGPGCDRLATDPAVTALLGHIRDQGTAVLVSAPASAVPQAVHEIALPTSGGARTIVPRRNRRAQP